MHHPKAIAFLALMQVSMIVYAQKTDTTAAIINYQLKDKDISVSCLTPGPVFTKSSIKEETKKKLGWPGMRMAVPPEKVGEIAVRKTLRRKQLIIPGTLPKILSAVLRIVPRRFSSRLYGKLGEED